MIRFTLFGLVSCICLGCGPGSPTIPQPPTIHRISVLSLASVYRHNPQDRTWHNCHIQCQLDPNTYTIHHDHIEGHCVNDGLGCVWFLTPSPPKDTQAALTITGICRGITRDGRLREPGVDYYVTVEVVELSAAR